MTARELIICPPNESKFPGKLGFGAMRLPSEMDNYRRLIDAYLESGFCYFDTAYVYENSEDILNKGLTSRYPRDAYMLADKLPPWKANTDEDSDNLLRESLQRCGVDYFDFYLLHSLDDNTADDAKINRMFDWIRLQKQKGLCCHIGFSFHGTAAYLEKLLTEHPETEVVQLQLNYVDILRGQAGELHKIALRHNKPIVVMEPVKGGTLATMPAEAEAPLKAIHPDRSLASWAFRYAASLAGVTCVLSGMGTMDQVQDNLKTFNPLVPLTPEEHAAIEKAVAELFKVAVIPCTACRYCMADCPGQINIPVCFSLYNETKRGSAHWNRKILYNNIPKGHRADDCTRCGGCLTHCPQHIDIPTALEEVSVMFK